MVGGVNTSFVAAWAEQHASALGKELKDEMTNAQKRVALLEDLSKLKADLANCAEDATSWVKVSDDITRLKDKYPELGCSLDGIQDGAETEIRKHTLRGGSALHLPGEDVGAAGKYDDDHEKSIIANDVGPNGSCGSVLEGVMDSIRNTDQLEMINIQDHASKLRNAEELGSNLISVLNDTEKGVISNIRG